jgi:(2Fe-2S) ferredoxin
LTKKAPDRVLFCGAGQTFGPPGIASPRRVWYLTITFILMREIIQFRISAC